MNPEQEQNHTEDREVGEATNMEVVMFLIGHIEKPCEAEVAPGEFRNIRDYYLREARGFLPKITNPDAKDLLEQSIKKYEVSGE